MKQLIIGVLILVMPLAPAVAETVLSPAERAAVGPVLDAIDAAVAADAALPPATSDRERLERLGRLDQAGRSQLHKIDTRGLTAEETQRAMKAMGERMDAVGARNLAALLAMVPPEGWFSISAYGERAADAAFHIVQHADSETRKRFLPAIEAMASKGEADGAAVMAMYDRIAMNEGRPQRYGTQLTCVNGRYEPYALEDPARVEVRRAWRNGARR